MKPENTPGSSGYMMADPYLSQREKLEIVAEFPPYWIDEAWNRRDLIQGSDEALWKRLRILRLVRKAVRKGDSKQSVQKVRQLLHKVGNSFRGECNELWQLHIARQIVSHPDWDWCLSTREFISIYAEPNTITKRIPYDLKLDDTAIDWKPSLYNTKFPEVESYPVMYLPDTEIIYPDTSTTVNKTLNELAEKSGRPARELELKLVGMYFERVYKKTGKDYREEFQK